MGNRFEVYAYLQLYDGLSNKYSFVQKYAGESWIKAIWVILKLKFDGVGLVKIEWR